jgi:hypothetical protein
LQTILKGMHVFSWLVNIRKDILVYFLYFIRTQKLVHLLIRSTHTIRPKTLQFIASISGKMEKEQNNGSTNLVDIMTL